MKKKLFFISLTFFIQMITACISQPPQYASIKDGIRCPQPNQHIVENNKKSNRAPASVSSNSKEQICDQLFVK